MMTEQNALSKVPRIREILDALFYLQSFLLRLKENMVNDLLNYMANFVCIGKFVAY